MTTTENQPTTTTDTRPLWEVFTDARDLAEYAESDVERATRGHGHLAHAIEAHVFAIRVKHAALAAWEIDRQARRDARRP